MAEIVYTAFRADGFVGKAFAIEIRCNFALAKHVQQVELGIRQIWQIVDFFGYSDYRVETVPLDNPLSRRCRL